MRRVNNDEDEDEECAMNVLAFQMYIMSKISGTSLNKISNLIKLQKWYDQKCYIQFYLSGINRLIIKNIYLYEDKYFEQYNHCSFTIFIYFRSINILK